MIIRITNSVTNYPELVNTDLIERFSWNGNHVILVFQSNRQLTILESLTSLEDMLGKKIPVPAAPPPGI